MTLWVEIVWTYIFARAKFKASLERDPFSKALGVGEDYVASLSTHCPSLMAFPMRADSSMARVISSV